MCFLVDERTGPLAAGWQRVAFSQVNLQAMCISEFRKGGLCSTGGFARPFGYRSAHITTRLSEPRDSMIYSVTQSQSAWLAAPGCYQVAGESLRKLSSLLIGWRFPSWAMCSVRFIWSRFLRSGWQVKKRLRWKIFQLLRRFLAIPLSAAVPDWCRGSDGPGVVLPQCGTAG
eukprot:753478-Hanusia_phi.AAC.2